VRPRAELSGTVPSTFSWPTKLEAAPIANARLGEAERPIAASLIAIWCRVPWLGLRLAARATSFGSF
jgi:hypothetical protein